MVKKISTGTEQLLAYEENGEIVLTLNNPKYKNPLSEELTPYLRKILKKISKDSKYKLLTIQGAGNSFCSGGNIKKMDSNSNIQIKYSIKDKIRDLEKKQLELTYLISSLKIPTIAIITGAVAGAGFSLALSCDIRIGNSNAFFISNYSNIGLSGDYGISWYLTSLLGAARAKEIMFLNERIYAKKSYEIGLLNFLFQKNFKNAVDKIKNNILSQPPATIKLIKENITFSVENNLKKSLHQEAKNLIKSSTSLEHKLAIAKFNKN